jgi:hypothetical protein
MLWFNTTNGVLYVYDGTTWQPAAPSGVTVSATAPTNPMLGDFWYNSSNDFLYIWDGNAWVLSSVDALTIVGPTAPTPAVAGMLWHNTTDGALYVFDGTTSSWILAHPLSTTSGPTPPANPTPGSMWWNTGDDEMYVWDGSQWIATAMTNPPPVGSINYVGDTAPASPSIGELWYDTANNEIFIWDGSAWQQAAGIAGPQGPPGPQGPAFPDAPSDGNLYGRTNAAWTSGGKISGNLMIANTLTVNPEALQIQPGVTTMAVAGYQNDCAAFFQAAAASYVTDYTRCIQCDIWGDAQAFCEFTINGGVQLMGAINVNFPTNGVLYTSQSDERLKTDTEDMSDSAAIIDALKPISFRWKEGRTRTRCHGFSAQQLHGIFPEAVVKGIGDPGDERFHPWMADYSKLVPVLVSEIQDLRKRIKQLEKSKSEPATPEVKAKAPVIHARRKK